MKHFTLSVSCFSKYARRNCTPSSLVVLLFSAELFSCAVAPRLELISLENVHGWNVDLGEFFIAGSNLPTGRTADVLLQGRFFAAESESPTRMTLKARGTVTAPDQLHVTQLRALKNIVMFIGDISVEFVGHSNVRVAGTLHNVRTISSNHNLASFRNWAREQLAHFFRIEWENDTLCVQHSYTPTLDRGDCLTRFQGRLVSAATEALPYGHATRLLFEFSSSTQGTHLIEMPPHIEDMHGSKTVFPWWSIWFLLGLFMNRAGGRKSVLPARWENHVAQRLQQRISALWTKQGGAHVVIALTTGLCVIGWQHVSESSGMWIRMWAPAVLITLITLLAILFGLVSVNRILFRQANGDISMPQRDLNEDRYSYYKQKLRSFLDICIRCLSVPFWFALVISCNEVAVSHGVHADPWLLPTLLSGAFAWFMIVSSFRPFLATMVTCWLLPMFFMPIRVEQFVLFLVICGLNGWYVYGRRIQKDDFSLLSTYTPLLVYWSVVLSALVFAIAWSFRVWIPEPIAQKTLSHCVIALFTGCAINFGLWHFAGGNLWQTVNYWVRKRLRFPWLIRMRTALR